MSVGLSQRGEVDSVNNEQHEQDNRYDNHQDDQGFSVHRGTFPSAVPDPDRPRQSTAYSWLLSFKDEVARQNGSSYARDSPGSPAALTPKNESPRLVRRSADAGDRFEGLA
jgi:hypothetical protein